MSTDPIFVRSASSVVTEVDGQAVALNIDRGVCYGLNSVATRVWALIEHPRTVDELVSTLVDEYEVEASVCRADVSDLLSDLEAADLVVADRSGQT